MTKAELERFIEDNHRIMTLTEIEEWTGFNTNQVRSVVTRRGFNVITIGERTTNYIKKHGHFSFNELMEKLEVTEGSLYKYLKDMGIKVKTKHRDLPINEISEIPVSAPRPGPQKVNAIVTKADVINDFFNKYSDTITWQELAGNTEATWSSY